jgi:hypothetical protein
MKKQNCWEFKRCKREPGGRNVSKLGVCPAATEIRANGFNSGKNGGRVCWTIAGTLCKTEIQSTSDPKKSSCEKCDFFKKVQAEDGLTFYDDK